MRRDWEQNSETSVNENLLMDIINRYIGTLIVLLTLGIVYIQTAIFIRHKMQQREFRLCQTKEEITKEVVMLDFVIIILIRYLLKDNDNTNEIPVPVQDSTKNVIKTCAKIRWKGQ